MADDTLDDRSFFTGGAVAFFGVTVVTLLFATMPWQIGTLAFLVLTVYTGLLAATAPH